jgi:hypothetical protein
MRSHEALANRSGAAVAGATTARWCSGIREATPTAQGAPLRYSGALGPMQGGWGLVRWAAHGGRRGRK